MCQIKRSEYVMSAKWKFWLYQGRWGLIVAIGGPLAVFSFRRDNDGVGYVLIAGTVVVATLVYLFVDREKAKELEG